MSELELLSSIEVSQSDKSEGRGDDEGASLGNVIGVCIEVENDFAGAKSSSVKMDGFKGKIPVQEKAMRKSSAVIDAVRTFMYSGITL